MRAQRWFDAKQLATPSSMSTPVPGDNFASMKWFCLLLLFPLAAAACDYPDEGTMPLHRAVTKVKLLPETEAWAAQWLKKGTVVQYALMLDREWHRGGRCYWTVDARAEGETWRRFYVTPDGRGLVIADEPPAGRAPRKAIGSAEAKPAER